MATSIDDLKVMLGLSADETDQDSLLKLIQKQVEIRLKSKLHLTSKDSVPEELDYITFEVCIRRYNRLKNEGMSSYSQDGESMTFNDDDFAGFDKEIADYLSNNSDSSEPKIAFIDAYDKS